MTKYNATVPKNDTLMSEAQGHHFSVPFITVTEHCYKNKTDLNWLGTKTTWLGIIGLNNYFIKVS